MIIKHLLVVCALLAGATTLASAREKTTARIRLHPDLLANAAAAHRRGDHAGGAALIRTALAEAQRAQPHARGLPAGDLDQILGSNNPAPRRQAGRLVPAPLFGDFAHGLTSCGGVQPVPTKGGAITVSGWHAPHAPRLRR